MSSVGIPDKFANALALGHFIRGMRDAYARGENVMEYARTASRGAGNSDLAILVAYDLQAGSYVAHARANPECTAKWCNQLAAILDPMVGSHETLLEVGCGEATTLAGVVRHLSIVPRQVFGFDLAWSRVEKGRDWLAENGTAARLFVADLFNIPLADASIDVVYTSHSLEPNGGMEEQGIREILRVARRAVVLFEPIYELASAEAQARMRLHGYVRGLDVAAARAGAKVRDCRMMDYCPNPLNPSGVLVLEKTVGRPSETERIGWRCPLTRGELYEEPDVFISASAGVVYPILRGVPMLRAEHAIVASAMGGCAGASDRVD